MFDRFIEIRKEIFKTQASLAKALQVSTQMISNIEQEKNKLSYDLLYILLNKYNINLNYLLDSKGNMLLSDDDKVNNNELIQQQQDRIKELQAQVDLLKELLQSNNKQS